MKVKVEVECTAEEARQFFGLPDVQPMQAAIMARMETQMLDAVDQLAPDAMLRSWMTLAPQGMDTMREMFERFFKSGLPTKPGG